MTDTDSDDKPASKLSLEELHLRGVMGAHKSWANTKDRSARTSPAREAFEARFWVGIPDDLSPKEREKRFKNNRKAYFAGLALKSATAARKRREADTG